LSESIIKEELERIVDQAYMWSFVCFGIGVEQGTGNLAFESAVNNLILLSKAFGLHLVYLLGKLVERGVINQQEANLHGIIIVDKVQAWGVKIEEMGRKEYASVKQQNPEFLRAVKELEKIGAI
jgi:hypothetical protein